MADVFLMFIQNIFCYAYFVLNSVIPKSSHKICFTSYPDCSDNSYAFFQYLARKNKAQYIYVWLVKDVEFSKWLYGADETIQNNNLTVIFCKKNSLRGLYHSFTAKYIFFTHGTYWFAQSGVRQTIVNLAHGMPLKRIGLLLHPPEKLQFSHYTIATSPFFQSVMSCCTGLPENRVLITGLPRNDWLLNNDSKLPDILSKFRSKRFVTWMPTYRKSVVGDILNDAPAAAAILSEKLLDFLNAKLQEKDVHCLIKIHPMDELNLKEWADRSNICVLTSAKVKQYRLNIYTILRYCDRLITDYSSIFVDFSCLRRPIGFYVPDINIYTRGIIDEVIDQVGLPGEILKTWDDLASFMCAENWDADKFQAAFQKMHSKESWPSCQTLAIQLGLE